MYDMFDTNEIRPYKQITKLNKNNNCLVDEKICDIKSLFFWFDGICNVLPSKVEFYDGKIKSDYDSVKIIKLVSDKSLHKTYDKDSVYYLYYKDPDTISKYKNLIPKSKTISQLIDCYILDWKKNNHLINELKNCNSKYIELNYYIFK